jgi:hypothetical protein
MQFLRDKGYHAINDTYLMDAAAQAVENPTLWESDELEANHQESRIRTKKTVVIGKATKKPNAFTQRQGAIGIAKRTLRKKKHHRHHSLHTVALLPFMIQLALARPS